MPTSAPAKAKMGNAASGSSALKSSDATAPTAPAETTATANASKEAKIHQIHENASRTGKAASTHPPTDHRGNAYLGMKDDNQAILDANQVISIQSDSVEAYDLRSEALHQLGDKTGAKVDREKAYALEQVQDKDQ